ncbi:MAG TPA: SpoIIE family protein phosphatase [Candidatus Lachnoclostridium stercoravium]|uniref:SpoIIE family protein phosphatase n=1 Tax=Candidatus Lachnoclostridium stercoravium TaxID=2838633 RepID=A0A9D2HFV9_9FIRM|nr:SpoIIE family protein phosphatase [Candidatus Lachnoclostridium stercoravium]
MTEDWKQLPIIASFFRADPDGHMDEASRQLLEAMDRIRFDTGEDIVRAGDPAEDGMYIILDGRVKVLDLNGRLINEMEAGEVIGEMALIKDSTRAATVRADGPVDCAHISKGLFEQIAEKNKSVYGALLDLLYTKTTRIVRERERNRSELEIAARIQTGYLPKDFSPFQDMSHIRTTARMRPARGVGGDFYDMFKIDDHRLGFVVADVSGKGIPAALFMVLSKAYIKNYMRLDMPLDQMAVQVNNQLCENNEEELFVTCFICVLDTESGELTYVNAGHNRPAVSRKGGAFQFLECPADVPFGIMEGMTYRLQKDRLEQGDRIYLYTDGVTEAFNEDEQMFSDKRLLEALNRKTGLEDDPEAFVSYLYQEVEDFTGNALQSDDITMLYLTR